MIVRRIPIRSVNRLASLMPWYDLAVNSAGRISMSYGHHRGVIMQDARSAPRGFDVAAVKASVQADYDAAYPIHWELRLLMDNSIVFEKASVRRGEIMAHLAFYDPGSDTLEVLEFYDDTPIVSELQNDQL